MVRAAEFQEIGRICFWEAYEPKVKADLCSSAVPSDEGMVFIDPIPLAPEALAALRELGPPTAIVLTNGNHGRDAECWRKEFGVPVCAHPEAALALDGGVRVDRTLGDGETIGGNIEIVALPGAGPGEIALVSPFGVHVGDALIDLEPLGFALLPEKYCADPKLLRISLLKLLRFDFELLTFAHGHPLTPRAKQRLASLLT